MARKRKEEGSTTTVESNGVPQQPFPPPPTEPEHRPCKNFTCEVGSGAFMEAAIWAKEVKVHDKTVMVYSATVQKNYRAGEEWNHTPQIRGSEIHVALHVLQLAERWILSQRTEEDPPL